MLIIDYIKYCISEIHNWIIKKPRSVEEVVTRYAEGVRHLTSIYDDDVYDDDFCSFIWNWQVAVNKAKGRMGRAWEEEVLSHFCNIRKSYQVERYITCAKYCLTERMEGMSRYIVRGLERIHDAKRAQEIMRDCGLE